MSSWLSAPKWARRAPSEALPLPLYTVCQLELAVLACEEPVDSFLMGCFLTSLLCCGQGSGFRMHSAWICLPLLVADGSLRGWCWRSKSSPSGFAWGCLVSGATGNSWATCFAAELFKIHVDYPERDYLLGTSRGPMSYSTALSHLRRCLATYTRLEVADVRKFALHSLKTTPPDLGLAAPASGGS